MPELTGLELQSALIELSEMTPLIFMSGGSGASEAVTAFRHGAIDFLIKPFEDQELLLAIQRALEKSREQQLDLEHHQKIGAQLSLLSQREKQIAAMVAKGKLNRDIATELGIAVRTVKLHRMNMMRKLGANNVIELAKLIDQLN
jgi:FixJ family two-component response regulator